MFTFVDALILAFVALSIIIGVWRGFIRSLAKFCGFTVKIILSFLLCKPVAMLVGAITPLDTKLLNKYTTWASELSPDFNANLKTIDQDALGDFIGNALEDGGVPKLFKGLLKNVLNITPETIADVEQITLAELVGKAISELILIAGSFVFIFLFISLLIFILKKIDKHILENTLVASKVSRTLGGIVGAVSAIIGLFSIFMVLSIFRNSSMFAGLNNTINDSIIGGPFSKFMYRIIDSGFDFNKIITDWLAKK